ncbi:hypothetical protein BGX27_000910, partial [Mortierella sp. AM989]
SKYLPEFQLQDPSYTAQLTFQGLLSHRTGFPETDFAWSFNTEPRRDLIKRVKYVKTGNKLTSYVIYNNVMYAVAGEAAANVAGIPYEDLVHEKILKPLGLSNSGFSSKEMSKHSNFAFPYNAASLDDARNGTYKRVPLTNMATSAAPAGDMYSNVLDLVRWGQTIMHYGEQDGKQILNKDSVIEMLSGQSIMSKYKSTPDFGPVTAYGLGWILDSYKGNIVYSHGGGIDGYRSYLAVYPDSELVIAHLANTDFAYLSLFNFYIADEVLGLPKTMDWIQKTVNITQGLYASQAEAEKGELPERIENKPPSHEISEFVGDYTDPVYGDISVRLEGSRDLIIKMRVYEGKLKHYHYDSFSTTFRYSSIVLTSLITFVTGQDGKISGLQITLESLVEFQRRANDPLPKLRQVLEESRNQTGIAGMSVAIIHKGKLIFAEGFGKRNDRDPFTVETLSMIASVSKAFAAATISELVGEGKVDWNTTPVSKYLPEFQLQDPTFTSQLTFQDLLAHRTGFPETDMAWFFNTESRRDLIKRMKYVKSETKLRAHVRYNNVMYAVAGEAAANVAGIKYEDLVREKIFEPLDLKNIGFSSEEMSKHPNFAFGYGADSFKDAQNGKFTQLPLTTMAKATAPAGDIYTNALDLVQWGQTIMRYGKQDGKQILNKDGIIEMLSGQSILEAKRRSADFGPILGYGMGWMLDTYKGNVLYYHTGHVDGYISCLSLFPDSELVVAHLSNSDTAVLPVYSAYHIADELLDLPKTEDWIQKVHNLTQELFLDEEDCKHLPKRIKNKPSSHKLSELIGEYSDAVYGDLSVRLENNGKDREELYIKIRVFEGKLEHYHYDSFIANMSYSSIAINELVTFVTGPDGNISGLQTTLEERLIEFKRKE